MSIRTKQKKRQRQSAPVAGTIATRFLSVALGGPTSYDPKTREVDAVISTGASVRRDDWDGPYDEILLVQPGAVRLERLNAGAQLLDCHCWYGGRDAVLGAV